MTRARRRAAIAVGVVAFLAITVVVGRWLQADTNERTQIEGLLRAQARGDARAMAAELEGCDAACRARLARLAARLRGPGKLEIVRFDSATSHALTARTGTARVVWKLPSVLPTVQCVLVRRTGNALTGPTVNLLDVSAPIGREAGC